MTITVERRDILFFFPEVKAALGRILNEDVRRAAGLTALGDDYTLIGAVHTRDAAGDTPDRRTRLISHIDPAQRNSNGTVFHAVRRGSDTRNRDVYFFVPDHLMSEALAVECAQRGVVLPPTAVKEVYVDTMHIVLRIDNGEAEPEAEGATQNASIAGEIV